jgi:acetyl esterase/lipase
VVDFFGVSDLLQLDAHRLPDVPIVLNVPTSPPALLLGGLVAERVTLATQANPITYVTADDAPFLIVHGDRDTTAPHRQSVILAEALRNAGVANVFRTVPGAGHGDAVFMAAPLREWVDDFLATHLAARGVRR